MKRADGWNGRKMSFHTGSRRSQPPLALAVPLSRFTPRVGGGSAFFVRRLPIENYTYYYFMITWTKEFETGSAKLDQQHRLLIDNINLLKEQLGHTNPTREIGRASCRERG